MNIRILLTLSIVSLLCGCNTGNVKDANKGVGIVTIESNQKAFGKIKIANNKIKEVSQSSTGEIEFELSYTSYGMMLSATNNLAVAIKYDIYLIDSQGKKHYTSSCPLMAGAGIFESWPDKATKMSIENFRVVQNTHDLACE